MNQQQIRKALETAFPGLDQVDLEGLARSSRVERYPPDVTICHEGEMESTFYVILEGQVQISKRIEADRARILRLQGPGEFFGELALIHDQPRAASVQTTMSSTFLELSKKEFNDLLERNPPMALTVMREVALRLRKADQVAISDLQQKNLELAQANTRLEEEQQLRSEFLTTIAHEMRTPLTNVQGYLQLMRSSSIPADNLKEIMHVVNRHVATIVSLMNNILFLHELELIPPELEPLSVGQILIQIVAEMRPKALENGLTFQVDIAPDLPLVNGDTRGLEQALTALLDNAIKFSPDGGVIQVSVMAKDRQVCIEIADPGVGIPEGDLGWLFEPFRRVESIEGRLFDGVGLGLPIVCQVVKSHHGHIEAQRRSKRGTRFTITLPALAKKDPA